MQCVYLHVISLFLLSFSFFFMLFPFNFFTFKIFYKCLCIARVFEKQNLLAVNTPVLSALSKMLAISWLREMIKIALQEIMKNQVISYRITLHFDLY